MAKKRKNARKGTTKKRHKPRTLRKADQLLAFYKSPDTPMRMLIRGAVADQRILGDRLDGGINIGQEALEIALTLLRDKLKRARSTGELDKLTRIWNRVEDRRHKDKLAELNYASTIANTYLAERMMEVQAAIERVHEDEDSVEALTRAANPDDDGE
jgi:hypothetical protein